MERRLCGVRVDDVRLRARLSGARVGAVVGQGVGQRQPRRGTVPYSVGVGIQVYSEQPLDGGVVDGDVVGAGEYVCDSIDLLFSETVSGQTYKVRPGRPDGLFWTASALDQRMEQIVALPGGAERKINLMARRGVAMLWPSGAERL